MTKKYLYDSIDITHLRGDTIEGFLIGIADAVTQITERDGTELYVDLDVTDTHYGSPTLHILYRRCETDEEEADRFRKENAEARDLDKEEKAEHTRYLKLKDKYEPAT